MTMAGASIDWAYAGYLLWLVAGCLDFAQHRRSDLAHTSGLRESSLHGVQLFLLGVAALAWLALRPSLMLLALTAALVAAHAGVGYADTVSAFGRRRIGPLEQHVHSVLDTAPWIALGLLVVTTLPDARSAGWSLEWEPAPARTWLAWLLPPGFLCLLPWLAEYRASLRARSA